MIFLDNLINGLSLGSIYAIIALGYTMVYGIAKMLNFAHGDVIMVGAYIAFCGLQYWGVPPVFAILLAMVACTLLGITIEGDRTSLLNGCGAWRKESLAAGHVNRLPGIQPSFCFE